jgi:hypothetical protein
MCADDARGGLPTLGRHHRGGFGMTRVSSRNVLGWADAPPVYRRNQGTASATIGQRDGPNWHGASMARVPSDRHSGWTLEPRVDGGVKEHNEMTIGSTDDPENPVGAQAFEAVEVFESGSRSPSGPAVIVPCRQGRTHDRIRPARQISHLFSCIQGAVHTCNAHQTRT